MRHHHKFDRPRTEKLSNKHYQSDIRYTIQYTKWFFEILGVWPMMTKNSSSMAKYCGKILKILCPISVAFVMIPMSLHMILRVKDKFGSINIIGMIFTCSGSILKYTFIIYHSKTIKLCMEHMETDWMNVAGQNDRAIMRRNVKVERGITATSSLFLYTAGILSHTVVPLLKGPRINSLNETIRPLVYPGYDFFVDPQTSPTYEIIYCTTCISAFVRYTVTIAACNLTALFVTHACGQMQIVMSRLRTLFDEIDEGKNEAKLENRISSLIQCHVRGLRMSTKIDQALREICLIEVVIATLTLCLLEYLMMEWQSREMLMTLTYFILLTSFIFNIFIFCYIGELLKDQFQEVANTAYMIEWYRFPKKKGLFIVMMMAMANYPHKITAGGMMDLSISTFGIIIKTSVMYQNMLRAIA